MPKDILGNPIPYNILGYPTKKKRKRVHSNKKSKKIIQTKRATLYATDKEKILERQKGKCAGRTCAKDHGKKLPVNIRSNFDHIKPLALGGGDIPSNIQALCANCHQKKTREDRKKIAIAKKEGKIKIKSKKKSKKKSSSYKTWINPLTGRKERIKNNQFGLGF